MRFWISIVLLSVLFSCSQPPTRDNPYDLNFDLPEPENVLIYHTSMTTKQVSWEYDLDGIEGFKIYRKQNNTWQEVVSVTDDTRAFIEYNVPVNEIIQYRVNAYAGENSSDDVVSADYDNAIPAPDNFSVEQVNIHTYELKWKQYHIIGEDGFIIKRQIEDGEFEQIAQLDENVEFYQDNWEIERSGSNNVTYNLKAYIGQEYSDSCLAVSEIIPSPTNLEYERLAINKMGLIWQDNSSGEEGFRIDKKVGENDWIKEYANVDSNVISWIDDNAEINENLSYRVFAYSGDIVSDSVDTEIIDNNIPTPTNLELSVVDDIAELTWEYELGGIEGFRIEKKSIDGDWSLIADNMNPNLREWTVTEFEDLDSYRIMAFYQEYKSDVSNEVNYNQDWSNVPAGNFTWGENDEIQSIDHDYMIMKYEVTNQEYVEYLGAALADGIISVMSESVTGYYSGDENYGAGNYEFYDLDGYERINWDGNDFIIEDGFAEHPVVEVSWFGANAYAEYYGFRLPTEQEWEKAARGMTGYEYPWGNTLSGYRANYWDSGDSWDNGTTPVGYYNGESGTTDSPSPYGCYDMCGNVKDWTDSWYVGSSFNRRVLRGGAWNYSYSGDGLWSWYPSGSYPTGSDRYSSFRCARTIE